MDCKTAHLLLDFARPELAELEASEQEALENHLLECSACARLAADERRLDAHLGQAMRAVSIPAGLKDRLLARVEGEVQHLHRHRRIRAYWSLAAAAALLGIIALGSFWFARPRVLDSVGFNNLAAAQWNPKQEQVDDWLRVQKQPMSAPEEFQYGFLTDYHMVNLQGKQVPMLVFTRADGTRVRKARVYLLSHRTIDLVALQKTNLNIDSTFTVQLMGDPRDPRFAFLVVFDGESLDPFLKDSIQLSAS
jgi:hypothetical protein